MAMLFLNPVLEYMGKRDKRKSRLHPEEVFHYSEMPIQDINAEKRKARELRHSSWWKRKIAEGTCHYCGKHVGQENLTMDHKIPLARGGLSEKINLVPCCKECNSRKKYMLPAEWAEYLEIVSKS